MRDIFGEDWPDQRQTREHRAVAAADALARLVRVGDPLVDPYAEERARQRAAESVQFWRDRETRPLGERLGLGAVYDRRVQLDDPPLIHRPERNDDDAP